MLELIVVDKPAKSYQRGNIAFLFLFLITSAAIAGVLLWQIHQYNAQADMPGSLDPESSLYAAVPDVLDSDVADVAEAASATTPFSATVGQPSGLQSINKNIWGANIGITNWTNSPFTASKLMTAVGGFTADQFKNLGIKLIRFPSGMFAAFYHWDATNKIDGIDYNCDVSQPNCPFLIQNPSMSIDEAFNLVDALGGSANNVDMIYQANISSYSTDLNSPLNRDGGVGPNFVPTTQDAVNIINKYKNTSHRIKYVELGNEPWTSPTLDVVTYLGTARKYADAIKSADSSVKIILPGFPTKQRTTSTGNSDRDSVWTTAIQNHLNDKCVNSSVSCYDIVDTHGFYPVTGYDGGNVNGQNFPGVATYLPETNFTQMINKRKNDFAGKGFAFTEWNLKCYDNAPQPPTNKASGTTEAGLFALDTYLLAAKKGVTMTNFFLLESKGDQACNTWTDKPVVPNVNGQLPSGQFNAAAQAISFTSPLAGGQVLNATLNSAPKQSIPFNSSCSTFGCLAGGVKVPKIAIYAGCSPNCSSGNVYVFLINKDTSQSYSVKVGFKDNVDMVKVGKSAEITTLRAVNNSYRDQYFSQASSAQTVSNSTPMSVTVTIPPIGAVRIKI